MIGLDFKAAQAGFFDRAKVLRAMSRATARALNQAGRLVRKRAQKSIQVREGASAPGQPPHGHKSGTRTRTSKRTGKTRTRAVSLLREFLFYAFDPSAESVVVGPVRLGGTVDPRALPALEYGGPSTAEDRRGRRRPIAVRARPFMGPALEAERPGLPALWRDSVR